MSSTTPTAPAAPADPGTTPYAPYAGHSPAAPLAPARGLSISSLVLGIASVVTGWTVVVPIIGLVLGVLGLRREPAGRSFAIWGIVTNSVPLAASVLIGLGFLAFGLVMLPFAFLQ